MQATKQHNNFFLKILKTKELICISFISAFLVTCTESYKPDIEGNKDIMLIVGELIEKDSFQIVEISKSTDYKDKERQPVSGCIVNIEDDLGNTFYYSETVDGINTCCIEPQYINNGTSYGLVVNTSYENSYISGYDKMLECANIDTVYYSYDKKIIGIEQLGVMGVQSYVKSKRKAEQAKYCTWALTVAWLYKNSYSATTKILSEKIINFEKPIYVPICWMTKRTTSVHTTPLTCQT